MTQSEGADYRGSGQLAPGLVKLLLDGQQRITTLYGATRGKEPTFFDGNPKVFKGLHFHVDQESFAFYQAAKMAKDPLWIDVTELMTSGNAGIGDYLYRFEHNSNRNEYAGRLNKLLSITERDLHIDEITGADKSIDVIVDIFNRVNSGGTKLSTGDLALAKICASWPEARDRMKEQINIWHKSGYNFDLDWLLRSVNTVLTGKAKFNYLHNKNAEEIEDGLTRAIKAINAVLNLIGGRLGLDHDRVLFGRYAIPVMTRYLDQRQEALNENERDKLLFWYVQAGMWGRFSGSTETIIGQDLATIEDTESGTDNLIEELRLWHGSLQVEPEHFASWSLGARYYPVLYMLTRMGEAKDWGTGLPLRAGMLDQMSALEVHHIFPKSQLYDHNYRRPEVNALANFCFLTKDTNINISNRLPETYFPEIETAHPGALASQWIPEDPALWQIANYKKFLEERKALLAKETNRRLRELLHNDSRWLQTPATPDGEATTAIPAEIPGKITDKEEEQELEKLNAWVAKQDLLRGIPAYDLADVETGQQSAVLDLAWPNGIQEGLSQPVTVLLNEGDDVLALASSAGYRIFTDPETFKRYVENELLSQTGNLT